LSPLQHTTLYDKDAFPLYAFPLFINESREPSSFVLDYRKNPKTIKINVQNYVNKKKDNDKRYGMKMEIEALIQSEPLFRIML